MERIIVTIRVKEGQEYDMELPLDQKIRDLIEDISDSLKGLNPMICFDPATAGLLNLRCRRRVNPEKTLQEECVWNGDILEVLGILD